MTGKISEDAAVTSLSQSAVFPVVVGGVNQKATLANILGSTQGVVMGPAQSNLGSAVNIGGSGTGGAAMLDIDNTDSGSGSQASVYLRRNTSTVVGSISTTSAATAFNTSSDERRKRDPKPIDNSGLIIDALRPYDFEWTQGGRDIGVFAQEAAEIFPLAVAIPPAEFADDVDGHPWLVDYSKFIPLLLAELQALRRRVATLESK